jgi:hypothetical protein
MREKKRTLVLLWPLLIAPIAGISSTVISGPTYTTAANQDAIVVRGIALITWICFTSIGLLVTLFTLKNKTKREWMVAFSAFFGAIFIFYAINTEMN